MNLDINIPFPTLTEMRNAKYEAWLGSLPSTIACSSVIYFLSLKAYFKLYSFKSQIHVKIFHKGKRQLSPVSAFYLHLKIEPNAANSRD